jgi:uncharacterized protein YkvS
MKKKTVVFLNIVLFLLACSVISNCISRTDGKKENGYVNETDTLFEENTNAVLDIERTFFRKQPSINNGLIEFKQPKGETYVTVVVKDKNSVDFSLFVIEDFKEFLENTKVVMNHSHKDYTLSIDDLKSTYMRKSMTFKKGIFIRKEANKTPSVIFDLSEQDLQEIEAAYNLFLNE